ncbi:hypothetical protein [Nitrobacter winogradskyi]|uniref:Uncharacterized protein n=1 Tax=Nitrobacter winogradskyi TaxID=913 RepID=A0ACC6AE83_NITWI|nr:hypothetical protein [Nitrobacter winogradskyi]MCP1998137.1 hypothetical protein [Nitrobacter winogradskyi]
MTTHMENPALVARGVPNTDLLTGGISSEDTNSIRLIQVSSLTRRCAISAVMAAVVAPLLFGEGGR